MFCRLKYKTLSPIGFGIRKHLGRFIENGSVVFARVNKLQTDKQLTVYIYLDLQV